MFKNVYNWYTDETIGVSNLLQTLRSNLISKSEKPVKEICCLCGKDFFKTVLEKSLEEYNKFENLKLIASSVVEESESGERDFCANGVRYIETNTPEKDRGLMFAIEQDKTVMQVLISKLSHDPDSIYQINLK